MNQYQDISIEQAQQILASPACTVFDIRDDRSYEQGRLPGAQRFNDQLMRTIRKSDQRNLPVLVYCYHGISSRDVAQMLCDFGFPKVYSLKGGYTAWEAAQMQSPPHTTQRTSTGLHTDLVITHTSFLSDEVCEWLLKLGADPSNINKRLDHGMTALMEACRFGMMVTAEMLLAAGADINATNDDGNNALWLACFAEDNAIIKLLIDNGVNINNQNGTGATALIYAASAGKSTVVKQLIDAGADTHIKTQDDFTALDLAASPQAYKYLKSR